jgi:hypothetical protein
MRALLLLYPLATFLRAIFIRGKKKDRHLSSKERG